MAQIPNEERRTLILTGASRGIGHATVKRFSSAGWRVITCSRHGFPENCPWEAGEEDHIQVDLADPDNTLAAIAVMKARLKALLPGLRSILVHPYTVIYRVDDNAVEIVRVLHERRDLPTELKKDRG